MSTTNLPAKWQLDIVDDDIALEYNDELRLQYFPNFSLTISWFEEHSHFIRNIVSVEIEDNDSMNYSIMLHIPMYKSRQRHTFTESTRDPYDNLQGDAKGEGVQS